MCGVVRHTAERMANDKNKIKFMAVTLLVLLFIVDVDICIHSFCVMDSGQVRNEHWVAAVALRCGTIFQEFKMFSFSFKTCDGSVTVTNKVESDFCFADVFNKIATQKDKTQHVAVIRIRYFSKVPNPLSNEHLPLEKIPTFNRVYFAPSKISSHYSQQNAWTDRKKWRWVKRIRIHEKYKTKYNCEQHFLIVQFFRHWYVRIFILPVNLHLKYDAQGPVSQRRQYGQNVTFVKNKKKQNLDDEFLEQDTFIGNTKSIE